MSFSSVSTINKSIMNRQTTPLFDVVAGAVVVVGLIVDVFFSGSKRPTKVAYLKTKCTIKFMIDTDGV